MMTAVSGVRLVITLSRPASGGESDGEDIRQLFVLADEANYSGHEPATIDFARWTQVVRRRMLGEKA